MICIIPARGGSKRIAHKNIVDVGGKPLITYTIEAAIESKSFEKIIVSTDSADIAAKVRSYPVIIHNRPRELSTDRATVKEVCLHLLNEQAESYEHFCCLYPTAALRSAADISAVCELVTSGKSNFAVAVTEYDLPFHQGLYLDSSGNIDPVFPRQIQLKSTETRRVVIDNGSTYAAKVSEFINQRTFIGKNTMAYWMPRERSVDVDDPIDLEWLKFLISRSGH